jgi:CheY-like chemotaxis protein
MLAVNKLLSGRRVLVIEDEMLVLMIIEDMLADLGCESVTTAATVVQAIGLIDAQNFDAAMLDMNLNGKKTDLVAASLAARGVPFIFCTGDNGHSMWDDFRDRAVLRKPFRDKELAEIFTQLTLSPIN